MLEAFGLDPIAETVYLTMLQQPGATITELAESLETTTTAITAALDTLAQLALLRPSWDDPHTLRPVSPEVGLESVLARQQAELLSRQHQIEKGRAALAVVLAEQVARRGHTTENVEELIGIDAIRERLEELTLHTRFQVLTFAPGGAQTDAARHASRPLDQTLLERGVDIRTIYLDSVRNDPATITYARWLTTTGGHVRTTATLPLRMIIIDRETAILPLNPEQTKTGAAIIRGNGTITAICALFEHTWKQATPLGQTKPRNPQGLTPHEHTLLHLLGQGHTDETTARKLGISDRTIRRQIADLTNRLGAKSRFQAGALATHHAWLTPEDLTNPNQTNPNT